MGDFLVPSPTPISFDESCGNTPKQGALIVAIYLPTKPHTYPSPRRKAGLLIAAGNTPDSYLSAMTLDTKRTLVLLQEILLALRANNAEGFKGKARSRS